MVCRYWLAPLVALLLLTGALHAADLSKIERTIRKEPPYQSKTQRYCLLVFGAEAEMRVWLVFDGNDTLFMDRNGDGDLTAPNEKVKFAPPESVKVPGRDDWSMRPANFDAGSITAKGGVLPNTRLRVSDGGGTMLYLLQGDKTIQIAGKKEILTFAARPERAPILHFNGPLQIRLSPATTLRPGDDSSQLGINLITPSRETTACVYQSIEAVPENAHPVAEVSFGGDQEASSKRIVLDKRC